MTKTAKTKATATKKPNRCKRVLHPTIKRPRNGGPMICYKHDALLDIMRKRRTVLYGMSAGMCWYQSGMGYEGDIGVTPVRPAKDNGLYWMFSHMPANLFVSMVSLVKSAKQDGKRMESALKSKNKVIGTLERRLEVAMEEYARLQAQLQHHGIEPLKPTEVHARILKQKKRK